MLERELAVKKKLAWWKIPLYLSIGVFALVGFIVTLSLVIQLGADGY